MAEILAAGDDKNRAKYLNNLSNLVHLRYQKGFNIEDLNLAIETQKRALDLMPENEENRSTFLHIYGLMLEFRFDKLSNLTDLKEAASVLEMAGKFAPPTDVQKPAYFFNFGVTLKKLFDQLKIKADLDNSILHQHIAIELASDTDKQKPMFCCHLGQTLQDRFLQNWMLEDLDDAIKYYLQAVKLVDKDFQSKSMYLNHLGEAFGVYFIYKGSVPHLDHAILFQRRAVKLTPLKNKALFLRNLAKLLETRFHGPSGNSIQDLEEAIIFRQQAAVLTPYFHAEKEQHIANLASSLYFSYKHSHNMEALTSAISTQKELVQLSSGNNSNKAQYFNHLGATLFTKFEYLHDMIDLEASITSSKQAVHLAADDDPNKLSYINNYAQAMVLHFENFGNTESLDIAMESYEKIVADTPNEHTSKALRLSNLGVVQMAIFKQNGKIPDLQKAILTSQAAVDQALASGLNQFTYLGNLANALLAHWQYIGNNIESLDQTIRIEQKIVDDIPDGHLDKPKHLSNLGNALSIRYEALGEVFDLNNGLYYQLKAIEEVPIGHSQRPLHLNNLGKSFKQRFTRKCKLEDLKTAINLFQEAVELTPNDHINKKKYLYNLALAFIASFNFTNDIQDLEISILHQEISLQLTPSEHPSKIFKLATFGNTLRQQASYWKNLSGLEKSLSFFQKSLSLMAANHPEKIRTLFMQSQAFEDIFEITKDQKYLQKALENYKQAVKFQSGLPSYHFAAVSRWISHAIKYDRNSCMEAYTCAFELLPQLAWFGLSIEAQFEKLYSARSFVSDATANALHLGNVDLATEWLEHGRSVVWNQVLQLRQPLEHLKKVNPTLAEKIETLSKNLSHHQTYNASYYTDKGLQEASAYETSIGTQHKLAKSWENLLKEAKEDPEFKYLFGNKPSSLLKEAASQGPVVMLNASKLQCDAIIIVSPSLPLLHLPLHQTSYDKIQNLQQKISNLLMHGLGLRDDLESASDRHGGPAKRHMLSADDVFRHVLEELWITIVKPVIDLLQLNLQSSATEIPHIWWCPTSHFTFLPIHAAGIYGQSENATVTLADYAVSSYTPNLGALLNARQRHMEPRSPKFLVVAQADTPGQCSLPGVYHELALMDEILPQPFELIDGPKATTQSVLAAIRNSSWVHFSCHGKQDMNIPTLSGLHLHDGVLSLRQIIHESFPDAEFAFLSACQTASGDYGQPDEALHLAGGMMLAGFRSVIATMWSIGDQDAPVITEEVYKHLFQNSLKKPSGLESAAALRIAIQKLRKQYQNKSFASWVPFIHVGI
ncbi:CHAT domain-containing protein [Collybia nuda]|uniref:CHAT domain-containing protein n=1 Tax=Collybia nuda TaxID=64659 RepID=A0A9P6CJ31_9AGAR|nr:CHAT domain-containing protein [Collybia nuda]